MDDSIALQDREVRANGVVGYAECLPEILDRPTVTPELGDYLPARSHQELAVPLHVLNLRNSEYFFNKSREYLTYNPALDTLTSMQR